MAVLKKGIQQSHKEAGKREGARARKSLTFYPALKGQCWGQCWTQCPQETSLLSYNGEAESLLQVEKRTFSWTPGAIGSMASLKNSYVGDLTLHPRVVTVFENRDIGEAIKVKWGHVDGPSFCRTGVFKGDENMGLTQTKGWHVKTWPSASKEHTLQKETQAPCSWAPGFPKSEKIKLLWLRLCSVWHFVTAALAN